MTTDSAEPTQNTSQLTTVVDLGQLSFSYAMQESTLDVLIDVDLKLRQGETAAPHYLPRRMRVKPALLLRGL